MVLSIEGMTVTSEVVTFYVMGADFGLLLSSLYVLYLVYDTCM